MPFRPPPTLLLLCAGWPPSVGSFCAFGPHAVRSAMFREKQSPPVQGWADAANSANFRPLRHKAAVKLQMADSDRRV